MDILAGIFELCGKYLVGNKNRVGFVLHGIASVLCTYVAFDREVYGLLIVTTVAFCLNIRNWIKWKK